MLGLELKLNMYVQAANLPKILAFFRNMRRGPEGV
jgi:hypothetical protein